MLTDMELNLKGLEIQKLGKNGTFFVFFANESKKLVTL